MGEKASPEAHGRRSNQSAELPVIKQEPIEHEEEANRENAQIIELRELLAQAEIRAEEAKKECDEANETVMEWAIKSADYESSRVAAEDQLSEAKDELSEAKKEADSNNAKYKVLFEKYSQSINKSRENVQKASEAISETERMRGELDKTQASLNASIAALEKSEEDLRCSKIIVTGLQRSLQSMELQLLEAKRTQPANAPCSPEYQTLEWQHRQLQREHALCKDAAAAAAAAAVAEERILAAAAPEAVEEARVEIVQLKAELEKTQQIIASSANACKYSALDWKFQQLQREHGVLQQQATELKVDIGRAEVECDLLKIKLERSQQAGGNLEMSAKLEEMGRELLERSAKIEMDLRTIANLEKENVDLRREMRERPDYSSRIAKLEADKADLHDRWQKLVKRLERQNQTAVADARQRSKDDHHHHHSPGAHSSSSSSAAAGDQHHQQQRIDKLERELEEAHRQNGMLESDRNDLRANLRNAAKDAEEKHFELQNDVDLLRTRCFQQESTIADLSARVTAGENHGKERAAMMTRIDTMTQLMAEAEAMKATALAESAAALQRLEVDMEELTRTNAFLASTSSGKLHQELTEARKKIEQLEGELKDVISKAVDNEETRRKKARLQNEDDDEEVQLAPPPFVLQAAAFGSTGAFVSPTANEQKWKRGGFHQLGPKEPAAKSTVTKHRHQPLQTPAFTPTPLKTPILKNSRLS